MLPKRSLASCTFAIIPCDATYPSSARIRSKAEMICRLGMHSESEFSMRKIGERQGLQSSRRVDAPHLLIICCPVHFVKLNPIDPKSMGLPIGQSSQVKVFHMAIIWFLKSVLLPSTHSRTLGKDRHPRVRLWNRTP